MSYLFDCTTVGKLNYTCWLRTRDIIDSLNRCLEKVVWYFRFWVVVSNKINKEEKWFAEKFKFFFCAAVVCAALSIILYYIVLIDVNKIEHVFYMEIISSVLTYHALL